MRPRPPISSAITVAAHEEPVDCRAASKEFILKFSVDDTFPCEYSGKEQSLFRENTSVFLDVSACG